MEGRFIDEPAPLVGHTSPELPKIKGHVFGLWKMLSIYSKNKQIHGIDTVYKITCVSMCLKETSQSLDAIIND